MEDKCLEKLSPFRSDSNVTAPLNQSICTRRLFCLTTPPRQVTELWRRRRVNNLISPCIKSLHITTDALFLHVPDRSTHSSHYHHAPHVAAPKVHSISHPSLTPFSAGTHFHIYSVYHMSILYSFRNSWED